MVAPGLGWRSSSTFRHRRTRFWLASPMACGFINPTVGVASAARAQSGPPRLLVVPLSSVRRQAGGLLLRNAHPALFRFHRSQKKGYGLPFFVESPLYSVMVPVIQEAPANPKCS